MRYSEQALQCVSHETPYLCFNMLHSNHRKDKVRWRQSWLIRIARLRSTPTSRVVFSHALHKLVCEVVAEPSSRSWLSLPRKNYRRVLGNAPELLRICNAPKHTPLLSRVLSLTPLAR